MQLEGWHNGTGLLDNECAIWVSIIGEQTFGKWGGIFAVTGILKGVVAKTITLWMFEIAGVVTPDWIPISCGTKYGRRKVG